MALKSRSSHPAVVVRGLPRPRFRAATPSVDLRPDLDELSVLMPDDDVPAPSHRWVSRPTLARLVQLIVLAVPMAASLVVAVVLSAELPHADSLGAAILWWAVVVVGSTIVLFAVDRVARRLLPLALLLRLSLLFPDQAPKRFRIATKAWSSRRLR